MSIINCNWGNAMLDKTVNVIGFPDHPPLITILCPAAFLIKQNWCLDDLLVIQHFQMSNPGTDDPDESLESCMFSHNL